MITTVTGQIVTVPGNIWYVHVNNKFDSMWGSRATARARKTTLRGYGVADVSLSTASVTVGSITKDAHS